MRISETTNSLPDRGVWWHVVGFALVGGICLVILEEFAGSGAKAYQYFETAVTRLYWALVIILAGLIDRGRKMFETKTEIRRVAREQALAKARQEGILEGIQEGIQEGFREAAQRRDTLMTTALQRFGVRDEASGSLMLPMTPEVEQFLRGDAPD